MGNLAKVRGTEDRRCSALADTAHQPPWRCPRLDSGCTVCLKQNSPRDPCAYTGRGGRAEGRSGPLTQEQGRTASTIVVSVAKGGDSLAGVPEPARGPTDSNVLAVFSGRHERTMTPSYCSVLGESELSHVHFFIQPPRKK